MNAFLIRNTESHPQRGGSFAYSVKLSVMR